MSIYYFSILDIWPYLLMMLVFIRCLFTKEKNAEKVAFISLLLFAICRYRIGWDYSQYESIIMGQKEIKYEYFSALILKSARALHFFPWAFSVFAIISFFLLRKMIIKYSCDPVLSWLLFFCFPIFFFQDMSTIRQSVSQSLIFLTFFYWKQKQLYICLLLVCLATLFHTSGFIGFFVLLLYYVKLGRKGNILLFIVGLLISQLTLLSVEKYSILLQELMANVSLLEKVKYYLDNEMRKTNTLQYVFWGIEILCLIFYNRLVKKDSNNRSYITLSNLGMFLFNVLQLIEPISAMRFGIMLMLYWTLLLPSFPYCFNRVRIADLKFVFYLISFALLFTMIGIYINAYDGKMNTCSYLPYRFWWNHLY